MGSIITDTQISASLGFYFDRFLSSKIFKSQGFKGKRQYPLIPMTSSMTIQINDETFGHSTQ